MVFRLVKPSLISRDCANEGGGLLEIVTESIRAGGDFPNYVFDWIWSVDGVLDRSLR